MVFDLTPEQEAFKASTERFAREVVAPRAAAIDETGEYPVDVVRAAGERGLLGVTIPKAWGGSGRDYVSYAVAIEAVARASATVAVALSINNSLVGEGVTATEAEVAAAVAFAFRELKLVLEPGGAVALAALMAGKPAITGKVAVAVLSGGNVDPELFYRLVS